MSVCESSCSPRSIGGAQEQKTEGNYPQFMNSSSEFGSRNKLSEDVVSGALHKPSTKNRYAPLCLNSAAKASVSQTQNGYCLPSSLVASPRSIESRNLDPNAREFTPFLPPHAAPGFQQHHVMPVPGHPFSLAPEMQHVSYHVEAEITSFHAPPFINGGAGSYGMPPIGPNSWDGTPMGIEISAGSNFPGCGPPILVAPQPTHVGLLPANLPPPPPCNSGPFFCTSIINTCHGFVPSQAFTGNPSPVWKEHISRTLLLIGMSPHLTESQVLKELEVWGPVRALELERQLQGLVIVHYYDLRHAREALKDIQNQHLLKQQHFQHQSYQQRASPNVVFPAENQAVNQAVGSHQYGKETSESNKFDNGLSLGKKGIIGGNVVWAQYVSSLTMALPDAHNQGTLVVFNIGADIPLDELRAVFQKFGAVKELRETPSKRQHKFVEFYDVRDAASAWSALNGHEICGKTVKIEFSRPGGHARRARAQTKAENMRTSVGDGGMNTNGNHLRMPLQPLGWNKEPCTGNSQTVARPSTGVPMAFSWPNYHMGAQEQWQENCPQPHLPLIAHQQHWQSFPDGQTQQFAYRATNSCGAPSPIGTVMPNASIGAGAGAEFTYNSGSVNYNSRHGIGLRNGVAPVSRWRRNGFCNTSGTHSKTDASHTIMPEVDGGGRFSSESGVVSRDSNLSGSTRVTRRSPREAHVHYVFDEREVHLNLETPRTTLMIRNIPNKYSQQMLLSLLDQHCLRCNEQIGDSGEPQSAYDFVYLPIDFKNRCNLGYAFVNFTTSLATLKFYKAFHEQPWEAFNSRKICQIAYARVQGREALEDHFRNSRFACDTDEYLPLVFVPPRSGIECPTPRVAASQLVARAPVVRAVEPCRSSSMNKNLLNQAAEGCSLKEENGFLDGAGIGMIGLANVAIEGAGA